MNDIINYNGEIWLTKDYLLHKVGLSEAYVRVAKSRHTAGAKSWRYTEISGNTYFALVALPDNTVKQLGDIDAIRSLATEITNDVFQIVSKALYSSFKLFLKNSTLDEAKAAAVIYEASNYIKINEISFSKSAFFCDLCQEIHIQKLKYLPKSWRNLRDKIKAYAESSRIPVAKNKGNQNRAIFTNNAEILPWLFDLGKSQHNYSAAQIYRKIRTISEQTGIRKVPSERWVRDWVSKPETQFLINQRYGVGSRFNARYRAYTPTLTALYAGDCWDIDGTRVNIIDHKATVIKDGKRVTANKFLYIVVVRDVMSGLPLGWEYCYEESADVIINALAMAVKNSGYLPYELRYDRFPGHNTHEWLWLEQELRNTGVVMTQTVKSEGKATIERWFGTLQDVFMSESDYYYGQGVRSTRRHGLRTKEYVTKMRQEATKRGYNFDDACKITDEILSKYSSTKYSSYSRKFKNIDQSPTQLHESCTKPNVFPVSTHQFCYLFGLKKEVSIRSNMIQTQIEGSIFYYGIDDCDLIEKYTGVKVTNCFDYDNLDQVHLFAGANYLGSFSRLIEAQQYGPNKDMRAVGKTKAIADKVAQVRAEKLSKNSLPVLEEVSSELGILQSCKLHKRVYESAESTFLMEEWGDEENLVVKVQNQY